jgi:preprotein translocase subunit SecA
LELKDVKKVAESKQLVKYDGIKYIVIAYILRLIDGKWKQQVELKDLKAKSSVRSAEIKDVEVLEGEFYGQ